MPAPVGSAPARRLPAPLRRLPLPFGPPLGYEAARLPDGPHLHAGRLAAPRRHLPGDRPRAGADRDHDGRIVADVVEEWAALHGQTGRLSFAGPAGGSWKQGEAGEVLDLDAVEFCRVVSGRAGAKGCSRSRSRSDSLRTMSEPVRHIPADRLREADPTPGMRRQLAFEAPGLWAGLVRTEPGGASGWHHHGDHETSLYVVEGSMRLEFGAGGAERLDAGPGSFLHVPAHTVHRESNPGETTSTAIIARAGTGVPTVNVDGPD